MADKAGRPTKYTKKLANEICRRIESGESLSAICREEEMPYRGTVMRWVASDRSGFRHKYEEATSLRAMLWADEIVDVADNGSGDVPRDRLSMDARKWVVAKLLPRYSDNANSGVDFAQRIAEALLKRAENLPE